MSPTDPTTTSDSSNTEEIRFENLNFDELCHLFHECQALHGPSELQGYAVGKLCGGARLEANDWQLAAWQLLDIRKQPSPEAVSSVQAIYDGSLAQLMDVETELHLLLPEDDRDLSLGCLAIGQWAQGFLQGLGTSGMAGEKELSAESTEAIRDLASIAQIEAPEDDTELETSWRELEEIVEYVRVAAITVFEEVGREDSESSRKPEPKPSSTPSIH